jgi:hypothetical protein
VRKITVIFAFLAISLITVAQNTYQLQGEGKDKKVSLIWTVSKWPDELQGVFIKRRSISKKGEKSPWEKLNQDILTIGNSMSKDLSNISNSEELIDLIKNNRNKFLSNKEVDKTQIKEIEQLEFQKKLKDPQSVEMLLLMFYFDFDLALIYGFGYVDNKVPKAYKYEYGLFPVINNSEADEPVATYEWVYGDKPDLSVKIKKQKIRNRMKKIQLTWIFDAQDLDSKKNIAGFNVYRKPQGSKIEKLNPQVIWIDKSTPKRALYFNDMVDDPEKKYTYSAAPVSIFKNEGEKYELEFNPKDHDTIAAPILSSNVNSGDDFITKGVQLKWEFEQKNEFRILGFIVERRIMPGIEYNTISDTITPSARTFTDKNLPIGKGDNFHYRVTALQDESYPLWSNVERLFYNPKPDLSKTKLKATPKIENDRILVELNWEGSETNFKLAKGYGIYTDRSGGIIAYEQGIEPIKGFNYNYEIEGVTGTNYLFAVALIDNNEVATIVTDTVKVIIPTTNLPFISIWPISTNKQKVTISWKYKNNIPDLEGFRVYANDALIADQQEIGKDLRTWTTKDLEPGRYNFQIEAITSFGITSPRSNKMKITVKVEE